MNGERLESSDDLILYENFNDDLGDDLSEDRLSFQHLRKNTKWTPSEVRECFNSRTNNC